MKKNKLLVTTILLFLSIILNFMLLIRFKEKNNPFFLAPTDNDTSGVKFYFDTYRVIAIPTKSNMVSIDEKFEGLVSLSVWNSHLQKPFIIIGDSIINGNLTGKLDTFQTINWELLFNKGFNTYGNKNVYGKYYFWLTNERIECVDFQIPVKVDSIE